MKPNFLDNNTGEKILVQNFKVKYQNGERVYFDSNWNKINVTKLGNVQNIGVRTETKNRI
jgi:hypothetical protein